MKRILAVLATVLGLSLLAPPLWAKSADLTLVPTRIVLEGNARYATVTLKNTGDAAGRYRIELVDASMGENGGVKVRDDGSRDPFSALEILSVSPRSMTLKPDEFQTIRLLVKTNGTMASGEYRSHLKVQMVESDYNADKNQSNTEAANISIKPRLAMVIPVIVRYGETSFKVSIDDAKIVPAAGAATGSQIDVTFGFEGTRSVLGDVKVTHIGTDGKESLLKFFPGVAIYRGTPKRNLTFPLEIPQGVNIHGGKVIVSYLTQDKDGGKPMAQKEINP